MQSWYFSPMEWIRLIVAALLSAAISVTLASIKNSRETDVKLAVLENKIQTNKDSMDRFERTTTASIEEIACDMKTAARELLQAASDVKAMSQTQNIVNSVSTKLLDSLSTKVETHGSMIAELRGRMEALKVLASKTATLDSL